MNVGGEDLEEDDRIILRWILGRQLVGMRDG
jgi:hypothetical protein